MAPSDSYTINTFPAVINPLRHTWYSEKRKRSNKKGAFDSYFLASAPSAFMQTEKDLALRLRILSRAVRGGVGEGQS